MPGVNPPVDEQGMGSSVEQQLYLGQTPLRANQRPVQGRQVTLEGESFYQIANFDRMRPFFMTISGLTSSRLMSFSVKAL